MLLLCAFGQTLKDMLWFFSVDRKYENDVCFWYSDITIYYGDRLVNCSIVGKLGSFFLVLPGFRGNIVVWVEFPHCFHMSTSNMMLGYFVF